MLIVRGASNKPTAATRGSPQDGLAHEMTVGPTSWGSTTSPLERVIPVAQPPTGEHDADQRLEPRHLYGDGKAKDVGGMTAEEPIDRWRINPVRFEHATCLFWRSRIVLRVARAPGRLVANAIDHPCHWEFPAVEGGDDALAFPYLFWLEAHGYTAHATEPEIGLAFLEGKGYPCRSRMGDGDRQVRRSSKRP